MSINFYYKDSQESPEHEAIISAVVHAVRTMMPLPDSLDICLYPLQDNVYGGIDKMRVNRIGINSEIALEAIPKVLIQYNINFSFIIK